MRIRGAVCLWLLDVELYSEVFRADLISIRMQELNMADTPALQQAVKGYGKTRKGSAVPVSGKSASLFGFQNGGDGSARPVNLFTKRVLSGLSPSRVPFFVPPLLIHLYSPKVSLALLITVLKKYVSLSKFLISSSICAGDFCSFIMMDISEQDKEMPF